jgi:putative transposase
VITLNYQYKLKLTTQQASQVEEILLVCKSVYNFAVCERKDWLNSRKSPVNACSIKAEYIIPADVPYPNYYHQAKQLTKAKEYFPRLKTVNAQVLQQVLKTVDKAFTDMKAKGFGFPRFKRKLKSFVFPQLSKNCLGNGRVKLPQIGWVNIRQSREYPSRFTAKQIRVVKKASGYYLMICFQSHEVVPDNPVGDISLGIDAGIESFVATSRGELIKAPRFLLEVLSKLKLLQRRLKHKTKGSKNWLKLQNKIARVHEKVADTRRDWQFKLANQLCDIADNLFVEHINFKSWAKGLFSKISNDLAPGQFFNEILPFVCQKRGKYFLKVDKDGTSQTCPKCDAHTGKKSLKMRVHSCCVCGHQESRDTAAARVIRKRGLEAVGHTVLENACGGELAGVKQLMLFDLVKCLRSKNPLSNQRL